MLPPKKSNKKPSPAKKYKTSAGDSLAEDVFEILDPTGISSYDDVYRSYKENGLFSWQTGLEVLGALPIIGKAGKGIKIANTSSKLLKSLSKTNKITAKAEKVLPAVLKAGKDFGKTAHKVSRGGKANPIAAAAIATGIGAEGLQKVTKVIQKGTKKGVKEIIKKTPSNKRVINETVATINSANTLSDATGLVKDQVVTPIANDIKENIEKDSYQPIIKTVYYNTDPKRGEVEKPGTDSTVKYVPVSNSVQLKKWKEQKLAFGTGKDGIGDPPTRLAFENELMSKVITERNKDKNFVQRALNPSDYPAIINEDGSETTHLMGLSIDQEGNPYIMPTVIQNNLGLLQKLPDEDAAVEYAKKTGEGIAIPDIQLANYYTQNGLIKHGYGTNSQGIMKNKMNPRKKYANGTNAKGMDPNHYIISPAEALNDYNIMLAKAEAKANANPWLPIVAIAGQAMQTGIGIAGKYATAGAVGGDTADTKAAMGMNNVQKDVEVEGGEMYETPQGQVGEFQGPSHDEGGIPLEVVDTPVADPNQGEVQKETIVYSKDLKIAGKSLADRKATRERKTANLEKIASDNLADAAVKNAAKRKMMAIQKEEAADLAFQEQVNNMQTMADNMVEAFACGTGMKGIQKYEKGGPIKDSWDYIQGDANLDGVVDPPYGEDNPIYGNEENKIKALQMILGVTPDGKPGKKTKAAWNAFQVPGYEPHEKGVNYMYPWQEGGKDESELYTAMGLTPGGRQFKKTVPITSAGMAKTPSPADLLKESVENSNIDINGDGIPEDLSYNPNINYEALFDFKIGEGINDNASLSYGDPYAEDGVNFKMPAETVMTPASEYGPAPVLKDNESADKKGTSKLMGALGKPGESGIFEAGNMTKLIGNYLGMTAGIKTAAEQRSTDVTHTNVFANAGKESQRLLDNAKQGIETSKAQAIVKATDVSRGGKRGARGSARGVNQMRGLDWLYDTALQEQIAQISANAAQQISGIDTQKSSVAMSADQLKGQGEYQAAMANEAAKDAYYTALALGRKDFATGLQQTGKDFNDIKQNKVINNLLSQYGQWFKTNADGTVSNKNEVASKSTNTTKEKEIELTDAKGKKFKITQSQFDKLMNPTV